MNKGEGADVRTELEPVRCLACGRVYSPGERGEQGPPSGCPDCGGEGWLATSIPPAPGGA